MGKFEIFKSDKNNEYYFRLKSANGENVLSSEGYTTKAACQNGIASVQKNSRDDKKYEVKQAKNGKWHFTLKAGNGQVIGSSQLYVSESGMKSGMKTVSKTSIDANIDDQTI